jgi:hypothetical protein
MGASRLAGEESWRMLRVAPRNAALECKRKGPEKSGGYKDCEQMSHFQGGVSALPFSE